MVEAHTFSLACIHEDLLSFNLQTVRFAAGAMLNGARLSVNGLYSITGVDWLIAL